MGVKLGDSQLGLKQRSNPAVPANPYGDGQQSFAPYAAQSPLHARGTGEIGDPQPGSQGHPPGDHHAYKGHHHWMECFGV